MVARARWPRVARRPRRVSGTWAERKGGAWDARTVWRWQSTRPLSQIYFTCARLKARRSWPRASPSRWRTRRPGAGRLRPARAPRSPLSSYSRFEQRVLAASTKVCVCVCSRGRTRVLWERTFSLPDLEGEMSRDEIAGKSSQRSRSALDVASAPWSTRSILAHSANRRGRCAVQHHLHGGARSAWVKAALRNGHTLTCVPHALWGGGARGTAAAAH